MNWEEKGNAKVDEGRSSRSSQTPKKHRVWLIRQEGSSMFPPKVWEDYLC